MDASSLIAKPIRVAPSESSSMVTILAIGGRGTVKLFAAIVAARDCQLYILQVELQVFIDEDPGTDGRPHIIPHAAIASSVAASSGSGSLFGVQVKTNGRMHRNFRRLPELRRMCGARLHLMFSRDIFECSHQF